MKQHPIPPDETSAAEAAPEFTALDHLEQTHTLASLMGTRGLLLGFVSDAWLPNSARLLRWMQRESLPLKRRQVTLALVVSNAPHTLHGFFTANPVPPRFPLLADSERRLHRLFLMEKQEGLALIDVERRIRARWLVPQEGLPRPKIFMAAVESFQLPSARA